MRAQIEKKFNQESAFNGTFIVLSDDFLQHSMRTMKWEQSRKSLQDFTSSHVFEAAWKFLN